MSVPSDLHRGSPPELAARILCAAISAPGGHYMAMGTPVSPRGTSLGDRDEGQGVRKAPGAPHATRTLIPWCRIQESALLFSLNHHGIQPGRSQEPQILGEQGQPGPCAMLLPDTTPYQAALWPYRVFLGIRCSQDHKLLLLPVSQAFARCCNTIMKPPSTGLLWEHGRPTGLGFFPCSNGSSLSPTAALGSPGMGAGSSRLLPTSLPSPGQPGRATSLPALNTIKK